MRKQARRSLNKIFINCGDPNGIGPEVTLKALADLPADVQAKSILCGSFSVLNSVNALLGQILVIRSVRSMDELSTDTGIPVLEPEAAVGYTSEYGIVSAQAGRISGQGIEMGVRACLEGRVKAIVTAPSSKEALHLGGYRFPGQTEMIASLAGVKQHIMILQTGKLRVGMATTHLPLRDVADTLTFDLIVEKIGVLARALTFLYQVADPRIAVCALNPHASDGGIFGHEEAEIILPAVEEAQRRGIVADGPIPADTLFPRGESFDGILAMYHDQGMIPIKMAGFGRAINTTGGLPFARTSPDHGTAFDIAGKMIADPGSMKAAIKAAATFADVNSLI